MRFQIDHRSNDNEFIRIELDRGWSIMVGVYGDDYPLNWNYNLERKLDSNGWLTPRDRDPLRMHSAGQTWIQSLAVRYIPLYLEEIKREGGE